MNATIANTKNDVTTHAVDVGPLVDLIWKNEAAITNVFDVKKSTIKQFNVEMFWMSMICAGIIDISVKSDGSTQFKFGRVLDDSSAYQQDCYLMILDWH
jgi:hypothetical protein